VRTDSTRTPRRGLQAAVIVGALLSLVVSVRIAAGRLVLGSPAAGWSYPYLYPFQFRAFAIFAIVFACAAAALVSAQTIQRREWRVVVLWLVIGLCAQGVLRGLAPHTMEAMFVGDGSNGFYQPTLQYAGRTLLRDFDRVRPALPEHPRTNMPGKLMLIYALERLSSRPAVLAWLVVVVSDLGGVLLYLFVRDLLDDRVTALLSLVFYLFVPARLVLFPVLNTVTPVLVFACAWCWVRLLRSRRVVYAAALGAASYGVVFFEPTPSVTGLLFACLTAYALWRGDVDVPSVAKLTAAVGAAFVLTYAFMLVAFRFDLLATLRGVAADAVEFNNRVKRPYAPWVWRNLLDLAFAAGICQAVLFGFGVFASIRAASRGGGSGSGWLAVFTLGTAATILATDAAGINRGEVVRLWVFLACLVQVPAAYVCARLESRAAVAVVLGTTLLQNALSISMIAFATP
jgi:hypothetical protein